MESTLQNIDEISAEQIKGTCRFVNYIVRHVSCPFLSSRPCISMSNDSHRISLSTIVTALTTLPVSIRNEIDASAGIVWAHQCQPYIIRS